MYEKSFGTHVHLFCHAAPYRTGDVRPGRCSFCPSREPSSLTFSAHWHMHCVARLTGNAMCCTNSCAVHMRHNAESPNNRRKAVLPAP